MSSKTTLIKHIKVLILLAVMVVLCTPLIPVQKAYASVTLLDPIPKVMPYYTETPGGAVYVMRVAREYYLLLPNEADAENISLRTKDRGFNIYFSVNGAETDTLSLSKLTPSGGKYSVSMKVRDQSGNLKSSLKLHIMKGSGIGTIYFTSKRKAMGRSFVDSSKQLKASGKAIVIDASGKNLTEDEKNQVVTDIHGRGDSSWNAPKKSYQIKFDKKISLLEGTGKEKKWVLLAQYIDPLHMDDKIAKDMAAAGTDNFSPRETWFHFYYDGEYRGVYLVGEKNEIKSNRIDIEDMEDYYEKEDPDYGKTVNVKSDVNKYGSRYDYQEGLKGPKQPGGFLLEMSYRDEYNGFDYFIDGSGSSINIKSPELGSRESVKYISEYFQEFCDAISDTDENGTHTGRNPNTGLFYYDYCDLDSLVDTYLANTCPSTLDSFFKSQYFYKDVGKKMVSGPIWDIDLGFGMGNDSDVSPDKDILREKSMSNHLIQIPSFRRKVKERYPVYARIMDSVLSTGEVLPTWEQTFNSIRHDLDMDSVLCRVKFRTNNGLMRWDDSTTYEDLLNTRLDWLRKHKAFLDSYIETLDTPDSEMHIYGDFVPVTEKTHKRTCLYHPDEEITGDCEFETVPDGNGSHVTSCRFCSNSTTEPCSYEFKSNDDGTHTGTCKVCGGTVTGECEFEAKDSGDGTHALTCRSCGYTVKREHEWDNRKVVMPASPSAAGLITEECACGAVKEVLIPKVAASAVTINKKTVKASDVRSIINRLKAKDSTTAKIILGPKVKTVKSGAFKGAGIKTLTVRSKKLTKKSVKGSLRGSTVKTVELSVGSKKKNKSFVKKYKKFFTKKNAGKKAKVKVKSKEKKPVPEPEPKPEPTPEPFEIAYMDTSLRMLKYLAANEQDRNRNILISPESILTAMAMTEIGAANNTLTEMEQAFQCPSDELCTGLSALNRRLAASKAVKYHVANSIWYKDNENDISVKDTFIEKNREFFDAQIFKAPFTNDTVNDINSWVNSNTKGMIPKIIEELNEDTVMLLINAIAFDGKWEDQYEDSQVSKKPFYNDQNNLQKIVFMLSGHENTYVNIHGANGFVKPYEGGEFAFLGLETPEGMQVDQFLQELTVHDFFTGYSNRSREYDIKTYMPEFKYDYSKSLVDMLKSMGIHDAFNDLTADFTWITPPEQPLVISNVLHKTHIELDRNGTKAAAVTAVTMDKATAIFTPKEITVNLDHPFVYAIIDTSSGLPLFIGTVKTV